MKKRSILSVAESSKRCRRCKMRGFAVVDGEFPEPVCCIAAHICNVSGAVVASIGISAPADRLPKRQWQGVGRKVMETAGEVRRKLGYNVETRPGDSCQDS